METTKTEIKQSNCRKEYLGLRHDDVAETKTVFGTVRTEYCPAYYKENWDGEQELIEDGYIASIIDGEYKNIRLCSPSRNGALQAVVNFAAIQHVNALTLI